MPPSSFLGMAILFAAAPLYPHYATLGAPYGIDPLADQQLAGGIMWLAGDVVFIGAILAVVAAWMRHEERDAPAAERRADAERARLRERARPARPGAGRTGDPDGDRWRTRSATKPLRQRRLEQGAVPLRVDVPAADDRDDRPGEARDARLARRGSGRRQARARPTARRPAATSSATSRTPAAISASETVTTSSMSRERWAKGRATDRLDRGAVGDRAARSASASQRTMRPSRSDRAHRPPAPAPRR